MYGKSSKGKSKSHGMSKSSSKKAGHNKDMWHGAMKQSTPCCPKPKYNSGLKNDSYVRPQSK